MLAKNLYSWCCNIMWILSLWLVAGVQYLQCINDGDAAVLLWTTDVCISNLGHVFWFGQWLGAYRVPSHCLIQCWQIATDVPYSFVIFVLPSVFMIECIYDVSTEINIFWLDLTWLDNRALFWPYELIITRKFNMAANSHLQNSTFDLSRQRLEVKQVVW